MLLVILILWEI